MGDRLTTSWEELRAKLALLPEKPGCYLMKDADGKVIYAGKAKVLKNRVRSYFTGSHDGKTQLLVSHIVDFEYIVTDTVAEALVLECNLIKHYSPHYNIMLRDDKTYPYIKITREEHPRLEIVRKIQKDKAAYFGPYPNGGAASETKKLLDRLYPLRKCKKLKPKVCLYYHIGQCLAPCEFIVEEQTYQQLVKEITDFLNGGYEAITADLVKKMEHEAEAMNFERAAELRDLVIHIGRVMETQKVTHADRVDRDVFGVYADKGYMSIQVFIIRQGKMIERAASVFRYHSTESEDISSYIAQFYFDNPDVPKEVWIPEDVELDGFQEFLGAKIMQPKRGKKYDLVELATKNARLALEEKFRLMERDERRTVSAMQELTDVLGLPELHRIEAFDNSNTQGTDPVAAMVVFVDGQPARNEYRKFKIKTVIGPDDYASMREVIRRRYTRALKEQLTLPDLIMVDGGKGQIAAAIDVLENELSLDIPVCGLAKDDRHRSHQLFLGEELDPVALDHGTSAFHLLQRIQDEVHRFAITFHRGTRQKNSLHSLLDEIPGIGEARRKQLLRHFNSLNEMKNAPLEEFRKAGIGDRLARQIVAHLQSS
ncbi:excinuclease ABC subunit UvrC [Sulfoacidibacillus ferrooxidans]|uniref:UvrABC system protein C n=1 Tax=Sulfoacidibacillus ferrooxidans TaxID=2005001 RepID=A0A9X1V8S4_9BACL|nr:excinuclease ABC subunit UvrC [Sulfoacidibacillus ferrooxidans]MCI0183242.1 UvrABC system protein C [Sulfoacidibacillus ferrooxidans]